jgi:hypothetical protein
MSVSTAVPRAGYSQFHAAVAGIGLLVMTVLAGFGNFVVVEGLIVDGDAAATQANIAGSERMFHLGVLALYTVALLDVIVAWALYILFSPTDPRLSLLAGWLRLTYAAVFVAAIAHLAATEIDSFRSLWNAGLLLFGASLVVVGILVRRSGWLPGWLGVLVGLSGVGYLIDSVLETLDAGLFAVSSLTFVGEVLLALLLVARSARDAGREAPRRVQR